VSELLLIGGGGHCKAAIDVVKQEGNFSIIGVTIKKIGECESVLGYPVLGTDDDLSSLVCDDRFCLVAIGQINTSEARITAFNRATSMGMQPCFDKIAKKVDLRLLVLLTVSQSVVKF